jgi:sulfatase maturation enzyme AslB (radical SAM superfamily)
MKSTTKQIIDFLFVLERLWKDEDDFESFLTTLKAPLNFINDVKKYYILYHEQYDKDYYFKITNSNFRKISLIRVLKYLKAKYEGCNLNNKGLCIEVTSLCNKECKHCYYRNRKIQQFIDSKLLNSILTFCTNNMMSVTFIGGEPLMYPKLLEVIGNYPDLLFFVATNSALFDEELVNKIRERYYNFVPVISLEGFKSYNDYIRGEGSFDKAINVIYNLKEHKIPFRILSTITNKNLQEVLSDSYLNFLESLAPINIGLHKYRIIETNDYSLNLSENDLAYIQKRISQIIKKKYPFSISHEESIVGEDGTLKRYYCKGFLTIGIEGEIKICPSINSMIKIKEFDQVIIQNILSKWYNSVGAKIEGCPLYLNKSGIDKFLRFGNG